MCRILHLQFAIKYLIVSDLLQLADEVCLKNLQINCIETIKKTITVSNVIHFFNLINKMVEHYRKVIIELFFLFSIVDFFLFWDKRIFYNGIYVLIQLEFVFHSSFYPSKIVFPLKFLYANLLLHMNTLHFSSSLFTQNSLALKISLY